MDARAAAPDQPGIVGATIVAHAPQLLSLPPSEDKEQVARVRASMKAVGDRLKALNPDLLIVISNAHGEEFVVRSVPSFVVHCGARAEGVNAHRGWWPVAGDAGYDLVRALQGHGFDPAFTLDAKLGTAFTIPLDFCGFARETPFLPVFVNAYVPPQPSPERCFAFGRALAQCVEAMGRRAVVIVSGGLSHYPGTPRYPHPDVATDRVTFDRIAEGNLNYVMSFDEEGLDRTGNVEMRSLQILAGAIGNRKPDVAAFEPSWHHTYAVLGWTTRLRKTVATPIYSAIPSRRSELARAIYALVIDPEASTSFAQDPGAFAGQFDLDADERQALIALDEDRLRETFSVNAMLTYQAKRRIESKTAKRSE